MEQKTAWRGVPQCQHHFERMMDKAQCPVFFDHGRWRERCHRSVHGDTNHHYWAKAGPCFTYNQEVGSGSSGQKATAPAEA